MLSTRVSLFCILFSSCIESENDTKEECEKPVIQNEFDFCIGGKEKLAGTEVEQILFNGQMVNYGTGPSPVSCVEWESNLETQWFQLEDENGIVTTFNLQLPIPLIMLEGESLFIDVFQEPYQPYNGYWGGQSIYMENANGESLLWMSDIHAGEYNKGLVIDYGSSEQTCTFAYGVEDYSSLTFQLDDEFIDVAFGQKGEVEEYIAFHGGAIRPLKENWTHTLDASVKFAVIKK